MPQSTAYIIASGIDYTYRFCGVTEIEYNFALNIDADISQGGDIINGARRLPNQIRLSVVETDVASQPGWAASMLAALDSIRRNRVLCRVVTSMGSWENMLLSEITATQDEANQYGWAGDIVFMQYIPRSEQYYTDTSGGGGASTGSSVSSTRKTQNNSSTKKNTGTKAAASTVSSAAASTVSGALATVLGRAGIRVKSEEWRVEIMTYAILPLTEDPWQVFTLDLTIDGEAFHAQIEIRYLPAPDQWYLSIWDHAVGEMLVNQIPLICSYEQLNDLMLPFRHLRDGKGMGSLFCLRNTDQPKTADPAKGNLTEFQVLWGDTWAV